MAPNLKDTLNLPQTGFPMRGNLTKREPARIAHWKDRDVYGHIQEKNAGGSEFILHDGPPFTNGNLHLGHALNKTLKDTILRYKWMRGLDAPYIPGWDSHGLPIEHKVSGELRENGRSDLGALEIREACARFAERFKDLQTEQFQRLGVLGDWANEYWTITPEYEAAELETFAAFVEQGLVYRSKKPVYWSIPCATALAEAEIEYRPHKTASIYVKLPLAPDGAAQLGVPESTAAVIWTTTPWTLPANLAVAVHPRTEYSVVRCNKGTLLVASERLGAVAAECGLEDPETIRTLPGADLEGVEARHPFIDRASPIFTADFVTTDNGTGCVHIAPGHGLDDYLLGRRHGLEIYCPLDDGGRYVDDGRMPAHLAGLSVLEDNGLSEANRAVLTTIAGNETLIGKQNLEHSYPHCWRSKTPVVFRAMDQWFVALDAKGSRSRALEVLDEVAFIPAWGRNRIRAAIENRPDWCISRQRSWGVPVPAFFDPSGNAWIDAGVIRALAPKIGRSGADLWFRASAAELLAGIELPADWPHPEQLTPGTDTLDVWIDSGCSHRAVLQQRKNLRWPADLYLEGSDQHRGWFQSSLLTSVVADNAAPFKSILTHGFIVKEDGTKLSKSDGEARALVEWIESYGADIIRLWICSQDYRGDVPVSDRIVKNVANSYRSIRNTLRFQLGNLYDFDAAAHAVAPGDMHPLDQWALHETAGLIEKVESAYENYEFHRAFKDFLDPFCANTLSATYHDILKDRLYTRAPDDPLRRSSQSAIHHILSALTRLLAPILPFTCDEAWSFFRNGAEFGASAVAAQDWPDLDPEWKRPEVAEEIRSLRRFLNERLNEPLEELRTKKVIGQSLDAKAVIEGPPEDPEMRLLQRYEADLPELFILSQVRILPTPGAAAISVHVDHADGVRCPRSWRWVESLVETEEWGPVSPRCKDALERRPQSSVS